MSRYMRAQLKRLQERVGPPVAPEDTVPRAHMVEYLKRIAEAKQSGNWTDEDAARLREAVRAAKEKRGEG